MFLLTITQAGKHERRDLHCSDFPFVSLPGDLRGANSGICWSEELQTPCGAQGPSTELRHSVRSTGFGFGAGFVFNAEKSV